MGGPSFLYTSPSSRKANTVSVSKKLDPLMVSSISIYIIPKFTERLLDFLFRNKILVIWRIIKATLYRYYAQVNKIQPIWKRIRFTLYVTDYTEELLRNLLGKYQESPQNLRKSINDIRANKPGALAAQFPHPDKVKATEEHCSRFHLHAKRWWLLVNGNIYVYIYIYILIFDVN